MDNLSLENKKNQILKNDDILANQLARKVIEKPIPPIWMILIPIFFVFQVWKIKQYSRALKDFSKNFLIARHKALDAAFEAVTSGKPPDLEELFEKAKSIPAEAREQYHTWISILVNHYQHLLAAPGNCYQDLIRSHYGSKTSFLLFCNQLSTAEHAFNSALIPDIEGDQDTLRDVLSKLKQGLKDHYKQEVDTIFS